MVLLAGVLAPTVVAALNANGALIIAGGGMLVLCVWLVIDQRLERTLTAVVLYLGLLDGYVKLKSGHPVTTAIHDVLLLAVVVAALARLAVRREPVPLAPWTGFVATFAAVVLIQVANPSVTSTVQTLGGVRQELEYAPLFFLGWALIRTEQRLRNVFVLLGIIAAINGAFSFLQFNLTPSQFSAWGPGYAQRIQGAADTSSAGAGRAFVDQSGQTHVRPFGLGSDAGFPGLLALLAAPGCIALLTTSRRSRQALLAVPLTAGVVLLVITGQSRGGVVGTVFAIVVYGALVGISRRAAKILIGGLVVGLVAFGMVTLVSKQAKSGSFFRWQTLAPAHLVHTVLTYKSHSVSLIPMYAAKFPFGAGIGRGGATTFLAKQNSGLVLDSETEVTFLEHDVGLPGLATLLALSLLTVVRGIAAVRRLRGSEAGILLAALVAPMIAMLAEWRDAAPTVTAPTAPFFWFATGAIAWWAVSARGQPTPGQQPSVVGNRTVVPQPSPLVNH